MTGPVAVTVSNNAPVQGGLVTAYTGPAGPAGGAGPTGPTGPPGLSATWRGLWNSGTTYAAGTPPDAVLGSNGHTYINLSAGNIGHDPTTDGGVRWADQLPPSVGNATTLVFPVGPPSGDTSGATDLATIQGVISAAAAAVATAGGGLAIVRLRAHALYIGNTPNTMSVNFPSGNSGTLTYGISIPSNVYLDLNGATIQYATGAVGQLITNATPTTSATDHDLGVGNGTVDCNGQGGNVNPAVGWAFVTRPVSRGVLRVTNGNAYGIYVYGNVGGEYDTFIGDTVSGCGVCFGNSPTTFGSEHNARINRIIGRNCTPWTPQLGNFPGNGVVVCADQGTAIGVIHNESCASGIKIEDGQDVTIGMAITKDSLFNTISTANSGTKFQGNGNGFPRRVHVGTVLSINQSGTGLYMERCVDCSVDRFIGINNGQAFTGNVDIWIGGVNDYIGSVFSDSSWGSGVTIRPYALNYRLRNVKTRNPNRYGVAAPTTTVAVASNGQTNSVISATITVASTAGFAPAGSFTVDGDTVAYTGITATTFLGCTGGTHTMATGDTITGVISTTVSGVIITGGSGTFGGVDCLDGLRRPDNVAAVASAAGGTFAAGSKFWMVTAINANGETTGSLETSSALGTTTVALASDNVTLPQGTINVGSTANWPTTGSFIVSGQTVTYTGVTATSFTGCTGGTGTIRLGNSVVSTATAFKATITWSAVAGATGYKVYRSTASQGENGATQLVTTLGAVTTYTDTGSATTTGGVPSTNTARTGGMYRGFDVTSSAALVRADAVVSQGHSIAPTNIVGTTIVARALNVGPPWVGSINYTSDASSATGPNYGKIVKSGYYDGADVLSFSAAPQPANGTPCAMPFNLAFAITVSAMGVNITTIGDVGSTVQLVIWNDDGTGRPGTVFLNAGSVAGDTATGYKEVTGLSTAMPAGRYWLGTVTQNVTTTAPKMEGSTGQVFPMPQSTVGLNATNNAYSGYAGTSQGNGAIGTFTGASAASALPRAVIKAA